MRARVLELEANLQAPPAPLSDLADAVLDQDRYKVLLQFLAAQLQGLHADFADVVHCAQGSQASLRNCLVLS